MIGIEASCESPLFACLASNQSLAKLLSMQVISPCILILTLFEVGNHKWCSLAMNEELVSSLIVNYPNELLKLLYSTTVDNLS